MASVYGNILDHFQELVVELPYYNQVARVGAGYEPVGEVVYVQCIRQAGPGRRLSGSTRTDFNAISPVLKINDNIVIWTYDRLLVGYFVTYEKEVYRLAKEKDWTLEAGFWAYALEKVVGNSGAEETTLPVKGGEF